MDRPFYFFVSAAAVIGFGTVWMATGVANTPPPPPFVIAPPPPVPTGPAHPDAASPLTIPVHVESGGSASPSMGAVAPSNQGAASMQPTPASSGIEATTAAPPPVQPPQPVMAAAPDVIAPPPADTGGPAPQSLPAVH